jgi:hypothetical protein
MHFCWPSNEQFKLETQCSSIQNEQYNIILTQFTRLRWPCGSVRSNVFLPVKSSRRTIPKLYTSLLSVIWPVMAYLNKVPPKNKKKHQY